MSSSQYNGPLDRKKMSKDERLGYESYNSQKARSKLSSLPPPTYNAREFIGWWIEELKSFKGTVPSCGRLDHLKGYSFENISMQDMQENSREGMLRNKTHLKTAIKYSKKVLVKDRTTKQIIAIIPSIRDAANLFDVSQRLIQFLVRKKYKGSRKIAFDLEAA